MNLSKLIGSTMILIGTMVGASMIALPLVCPGAGFFWASILIIAMCLVSMITGLMVIEVNLAMPNDTCSFSAMAKTTLGNFGRIVTWISYLFLLYAVTSLYIIGQTDLITHTIGPLIGIEIPAWLGSVLFIIILGVAVFWSTEAVDYCNRSLLSLKGILLIAAIAFIMPHVEVNKLFSKIDPSQVKFLWAAAPTFICAFCYQFIIPSLRLYIGDKPKQLRLIVIFGTLSALIIYLLWLVVTLGVVPLEGEYGFINFVRESGISISKFNQLIIKITNNKWVTNSLHSFTNIAMTTSFLGVALGLFDFLAEGFKRPNTRFGRFQTSLLTFVPPLAFALFYPEGFLMALNYAAVAVAILTVILPALMVYSLRKNKQLSSPYRVKCNSFGIAIIVLIGILIGTLALMYNMNLLPTL